MKIVFGIFSVIIVIFTIDFVLSNGQPVAFGSWLLPWQAEIPAGLAVLCALAFGLLIGGFLTWSTGSRARRRARHAERRVEALERELGNLARRAEAAEREAITMALPPPAPIPQHGADGAAGAARQ
ncbi:MAG: lipopolysaccharide assembly protein LapA domain-containing protein [Alphaproteobacteria bacterium]